MSAAKNCGLRKFNAGLVSACIVGLGLSYYAYIVETKKEQDDSYTAMCDISEYSSCTKAFMTEYGKGFGLVPKNSIFNIPNSIYGLVFYSLVTALSISNDYVYSAAVLILGIFSNITSIYLAHILYVFKNICVVCVSTYIVNAVIMVFAFKKFKKLSISEMHRKKMK